MSFDDVRISAVFADGQDQSIAWQAIDCVAIETRDTGPWEADVWWLLEGVNIRLAYPLGATGDRELLEEYPVRFTGFDYSSVITAMGSTSNARFVCWRRRS